MEFSKFYHAQHSGRKLTHLHNLSKGNTNFDLYAKSCLTPLITQLIYGSICQTSGMNWAVPFTKRACCSSSPKTIGWTSKDCREQPVSMTASLRKPSRFALAHCYRL